MSEHQRKHKRPVFLLSVIGSTLIVSGISLIGSWSIYKKYQQDPLEQPIVAAVFQGLHDGVYPWQMVSDDQMGTEMVMAEGLAQVDENDDVVESEVVVETKTDASEEKINSKIENKQEENKQEENKQEKNTQEKTKETNSEQKSDKSITIGEVDDAYFDDVLFIGDSRTLGLSEYSELTNATYYCDVGLSVYSVFDKEIVKLKKKTVTIEKALKKKKFKKIYIMLGINELGTGTAQTFAKKYEEMIERIMELQPNAYIVIQAIMNMGQERSDRDEIYNNANIAERNEAIKELADDKNIFYIDVNEALTDENGYLPEEYTFDSVHLKGKYYSLWEDFLRTHGLVESMIAKQ